VTTGSRAGKTKNPKWRENFIKIHSVIKRLSPMFGYDQEAEYWAFPEKKLMLSVIELALIDKYNWNQVMSRQPSQEERILINSAGVYLEGELWHAEICGVDSDYVKRVIREEGL
jgi:hypothetical protein|tara:strand:- start:3829 stop:4170 length:342 start_codon:yes stop_codon:yes gene_type:complete